MTFSIFIFLSQFEPLGLTIGQPHKNPSKCWLEKNFGIKTLLVLFSVEYTKYTPDTDAGNWRKHLADQTKPFVMDSKHNNTTVSIFKADNFGGLIRTARNLHWNCNAYVCTKRMLLNLIFLLQDYQFNTLCLSSGTVRIQFRCNLTEGYFYFFLLFPILSAQILMI